MSTQNAALVTLVVGSDSLVGRAYFKHLQSVGKPVLGTSRRREALDKSHVYLDLSGDMTQWSCPQNVSVAVLCAGITSLAACQADPTGTKQVNVYSKSDLAYQLIRNGAQVIYLSTSAVFDGSIKSTPADAPICPVTEYGRQHVEAEQRIQALGDAVSIIRFTKILGPEIPLFSGWINSLKRGQPITPYSDMVMAPIPVSFAVKTIDRSAETSITGVIHASGDQDISYAAAASFFAETLGADPNLVQATDSAKENWDKGLIPSHTTLENSRLNSELGLKTPNVWQTLKGVLFQHEALSNEEAEFERDKTTL